MAQIKVIAFDVYGTILCSDDYENALPPRPGFIEFISHAKNLKIKTVTSSDSDLTNMQLDLAATLNGTAPFGLEIFDGFFRLSMYPKIYQQILRFFGIKDEELLVIGNDYDKDLSQAPLQAHKVLVPSYKIVADKFSFSQVVISDF
ncbi:MAG: HAD family hydrolase [Patescibacteria group bacterium]